MPVAALLCCAADACSEVLARPAQVRQGGLPDTRDGERLLHGLLLRYLRSSQVLLHPSYCGSACCDAQHESSVASPMGETNIVLYVPSELGHHASLCWTGSCSNAVEFEAVPDSMHCI